MHSYSEETAWHENRALLVLSAERECWMKGRIITYFHAEIQLSALPVLCWIVLDCAIVAAKDNIVLNGRRIHRRTVSLACIYSTDYNEGVLIRSRNEWFYGGDNWPFSQSLLSSIPCVSQDFHKPPFVYSIFFVFISAAVFVEQLFLYLFCCHKHDFPHSTSAPVEHIPLWFSDKACKTTRT